MYCSSPTIVMNRFFVINHVLFERNLYVLLNCTAHSEYIAIVKFTLAVSSDSNEADKLAFGA